MNENKQELTPLERSKMRFEELEAGIKQEEQRLNALVASMEYDELKAGMRSLISAMVERKTNTAFDLTSKLDAMKSIREIRSVNGAFFATMILKGYISSSQLKRIVENVKIMSIDVKDNFLSITITS